MHLRKDSGGEPTDDVSPEELKDRRARCVALERAYVHDVYDQLAPHLARPRILPRVQEFLQELELGSLVADVGCGSGQYLEAGGTGCTGCDRCPTLAAAAAARGHEVLLCDVLSLPYRDESVDAALSIAVIHHLASTERRVQALRELSRVLRVGGRVLITVWAVEQSHRKFESQDVLVPYRQPTKSSSEERGSSVERELTSTTTSEDDLLMYQSYNAPSDSDSGFHARRRRCSHRDDSSSDLSSPGETCYSFVRRALQKLSSTSHNSRPYFYRSCRGAWFTEGPSRPEEENESDDNELIELRHLDAGLPPVDPITRPPSILDQDKTTKGKSKSLGDVLSIIPSILRSRRKKEGCKEFQKRCSTASDPREYLRRIVQEKNGIVRSKSTVSCFARFEHLREDSLLSPMAEDHELPEVGGEEVVNQLTSSDIANGNSIINQDQLSTLVKGQLQTYNKEEQDLFPTKSWFNSFNNANLERRNTATIQSYITAKIQRGGSTELFKKRMRLYNQRLQEKAMLKNLYNQCAAEDKTEEKQELATYYSMPDLHTLCEGSVEKLSRNTIFRDASSRRKQETSSFESDIFVEDVEATRLPQTRPRIVKRSLSVGTGNRPSDAEPPRFSTSSPSTPRSRNVSEDSEESVISVVPRKCSSLQSDTSIDSEESIISVIQRSSSEIEAMLQRKELHSKRASPLSMTPGGPSSPECSPTRKVAPPLLGGRQYLEKFADCQVVVIRDIIGAVVSFAHCRDVIPQWEVLQDLPQEEPFDVIGKDDESSSGDTNSYMSTPDASVAAEGSCCGDDIPPLDFDNKDLEDYSCLSDCEVPSLKVTSAEPDLSKSETLCSDTETTSSNVPQTSSEETIEALSQILFLDVCNTPSPETQLSPEKTISDDSHEEDADNVKLDHEVQPDETNNSSPCATGTLVYPLSEESDNDDVSCIQPIRLTLVKKPQFTLRPSFAQTAKSSVEQSTERNYWERLLPVVLSIDAADENDDKITAPLQHVASPDSSLSENVTTQQPLSPLHRSDCEVTTSPEMVHTSDERFPPQVHCSGSTGGSVECASTPEMLTRCRTPEVFSPTHHSNPSSADSLYVAVARHAVYPDDDSSPDDSLESIAECNEEEEEMKGDYCSSSRRKAFSTDDIQTTSAEEKDIATSEDFTRIKDADDKVIAASQDDDDGAEERSKDPSDDIPFNIIIEDYSEESDSCNDPNATEESPATDNFDSLTVNGLVSSTSNGSSSTASFQTVIQCPVPGSADTEKLTDDKVEDDADSKRDRQHDKKESMSLSSSQESLHDTDVGGNSLTLHRYYHVFREGELDNLIDKYVQNLHVISSYYDRASWCVIAEKVQVWTI
ncbi:uncharacterized protein LOC135395069 [Ornithodoros turicata]|uniref:uncharacterized protein LOC135395069 n=1 Tax=Ornithodoros turicata TaxID=34597 RepID=UPI003139F568